MGKWGKKIKSGQMMSEGRTGHYIASKEQNLNKICNLKERKHLHVNDILMYCRLTWINFAC